VTSISGAHAPARNSQEHIESLDDASQKDEALLGHLLRVAARVANAEGLAEGGYRTVINNGAGAGQSVFHLHVHVLGGRPLNCLQDDKLESRLILTSQIRRRRHKLVT